MADMWTYIVDNLATLTLVLPRVAGIFVIAPIFGGRYLAAAKVLLTLVTSAAVLFMVPPAAVADGWGLILAVCGEFLLGLAIGFVAQLVLVSVQVAGQMIDMEMGFGIVNVIDPQQGTPVPLVGNFLWLLALLLFLGINGHHLLLTGLVRSFQLVPPGGVAWRPEMAELAVGLFSRMFLTSVLIAAPVVATLFLTNVALGIVARTVPQMNVFIIGLPVKVLAGAALLTTVLPLFIILVRQLVGSMGEAVDSLLRLAA